MEVEVRCNHGSSARHARTRRVAQVDVRYLGVRIPPPSNDPRTAGHEGLQAWVVLVQERHTPEGEKGLEWLLICSEPVTSDAEAMQVIRWYGHRWVIEQWHRVLKEALRLEKSQMDDGADIQRLSALLSVQAVQLMVLRDLAQGSRKAVTDDLLLPESLLIAGSMMADVKRKELTYQKLWDALARRGGWLGRKNDGPPGWKVLWRGWRELVLTAEVIEHMQRERSV